MKMNYYSTFLTFFAENCGLACSSCSITYLVFLVYLSDRILWAFSLYLEAVAILPQLVLLQRTRNIDNLTGQYVFFSGVIHYYHFLTFYLKLYIAYKFLYEVSFRLGFVSASCCSELWFCGSY